MKRKLINKIKNNASLLKKANLLVMVMCVYSANVRCCWIVHQPEMPEEVKKFRRF